MVYLIRSAILVLTQFYLDSDFVPFFASPVKWANARHVSQARVGSHLFFNI
uniref:Uncharacterized protein n=1 Tax=Anguilla anguilla TaxID=7936 RepID=A0A0E9WV82_ANGAN